MANKLLSIAIPAYNRPEFLEISLNNLCKQINKIDPSQIDILISDDSDKENQKKNKKIADYYKKLLPVSYCINLQKGYESNWLNCLKRTKGQFLLVLGDDDVLVNDAIIKIINVIKLDGRSAGLISFRSYGYDFNFQSEFPVFNQTGSEVLDDHKQFFLRCGPKMTHISTMVLNKGMLDGFDYNINHSPSIIQMHFIFYIVSISLKTVFINDYLIAAYRNNNEWGVEGIRLFSFDIGKIMDKYIADKKIIGSFEKQFINKFYPIDIIRARSQKDTNLKKSYLKNLRLLKKRYKNNFDFALLMPVIYLPFKIARLYAYFFSFLVRLFYKDKLDALNFLINKIRFLKL